MKIPTRHLSSLFTIIGLGIGAAVAQTPPQVSLQFSAGHPAIRLQGIASGIYSLQSTTDLPSSGQWKEEAQVQLSVAGEALFDLSAPSTRAPFYRAVSVVAPATNQLVFIPAGTFVMGSPPDEPLRGSTETQHTVTLSHGFWMGTFLVTQGEYLAITGVNPSHHSPANGYPADLARPVEQVSWMDATNYCGLRTQQERAAGLIPQHYAYRLPTESGWEYACRAGTTTAFYTGSTLRSGQACFDGRYEYDAASGEVLNTVGDIFLTTTEVGNFPPNPWGLYDMIGNVNEWCQDWRGAYPTEDVVDPPGAATGTSRVVRGASFTLHASSLRSAHRLYATPATKGPDIGFRVVLDSNP